MRLVLRSATWRRDRHTGEFLADSPASSEQENNTKHKDAQQVARLMNTPLEGPAIKRRKKGGLCRRRAWLIFDVNQGTSMIFLNQIEIEQRYGVSFPTGGFRRFNAESCSKHQVGAYKYEFGYIKGKCCYAIIQKQKGGSLLVVERQSFFALNGKGEWKVLEGTEDQKNKPITFQFTPSSENGNFPSPLFASHQLQRTQLVIYEPQWQPDLSQVEANPI